MKTDYTTAEAAEIFGVTDGRIRQICSERSIGRLVTPRMRLLTEADIESLRKIFQESRFLRVRKNSETVA